jgi:hypothetical protein
VKLGCHLASVEHSQSNPNCACECEQHHHRCSNDDEDDHETTPVRSLNIRPPRQRDTSPALKNEAAVRGLMGRLHGLCTGCGAMEAVFFLGTVVIRVDKKSEFVTVEAGRSP